MSTHSASLSLIRAPNGNSGGGSNAVIRFNFVSPPDFRNILRPIRAATCAPKECPITWNCSTSKPSSTQSKIVSDTFVASYVCNIDAQQKKKHKTIKKRSNMEMILEIFCVTQNHKF